MKCGTTERRLIQSVSIDIKNNKRGLLDRWWYRTKGKEIMCLIEGAFWGKPDFQFDTSRISIWHRMNYTGLDVQFSRQ